MNITSSIYVLIAVSFCTASANEPSAPREQGDLEKKVRANTKNIDVMGRKIRKSKVNLNDVVEDLDDIDEAVTGLEEKYDGAVTVLEEKIEVLEEALEVARNDLDEAVTGLEEKHDGIVTGLEEKIKLLEEDLEESLEVALNDIDEAVTDLGVKHDRAVTGLKGKITLLEEDLKMEEIQFLGVASQSTTYKSAMLCNDGSKSQSDSEVCYTRGDEADPWWRLKFVKNVVINRIVIYNKQDKMPYTVGIRVCILSYTGAIVWERTVEKEEKSVYVLAVPNIVGQYVKIDKPPSRWIIMREVAVFGRYA